VVLSCKCPVGIAEHFFGRPSELKDMKVTRRGNGKRFAQLNFKLFEHVIRGDFGDLAMFSRQIRPSSEALVNLKQVIALKMKANEFESCIY